MKNFRTFKFTFTLATFALFASIIYAQTASEVFEAVSEVLILRPAQETTIKPNEEGRNRWIWARDGLALQKSLLNDEVMSNILKLPGAKVLIEKTSKHKAQLSIEKMIAIDYSGADENAFNIKVKGVDKEFILEANKILFNQLKQNYLTIPEKTYQDALKSFEANAITDGLKEKLNELKAIHAWEMSVREDTWRVLKAPQLLSERVWPKKTAIVLTLVFAGFTLGMFLDGFISSRRD